MFRSFGRFVDSLGGRYITAEDVGTSVADMMWVNKETKFVTGIDRSLGGSGDPSPVTALGVYHGMKACMKELTGNDSLKGKKVAVQGAGHVASYLCGHLAKEGAKIVITDIYDDKARKIVKEFKATYIHPDKIYDVAADVFCPCALGAIVNDDTIPRLKVKIIAGGANNQLADEKKHGEMLIKKGILYAPDYAINAGGLISVGTEFYGGPHEMALKQAEGIYDTIRKIFTISKREKIPTYEASNRLAEDRIAKMSRLKSFHLPKNR
jgi:leucine dehydrogenase